MIKKVVCDVSINYDATVYLANCSVGKVKVMNSANKDDIIIF